jgi:hypothetical protein
VNYTLEGEKPALDHEAHLIHMKSQPLSQCRWVLPPHHSKLRRWRQQRHTVPYMVTLLAAEGVAAKENAIRRFFERDKKRARITSAAPVAPVASSKSPAPPRQEPKADRPKTIF